MGQECVRRCRCSEIPTEPFQVNLGVGRGGKIRRYMATEQKLSRGVRREEITVRPVSYATARQFFARYEHLGNCGLGVWHWGGFLGQDLIAAVSFGTACFTLRRGLIGDIARRYGLGVYQICRGGTVPSAGFNAPSCVLAAALRQFERERGNCLIVAYADRRYNEVGTIYQACNGLYTGVTNPKDQSNYFLHGRLLSGWVVRKRFGTRAIERLREVDPNVRKIPLNPKYRYVFARAEHRVRETVISALRETIYPYPTRASEKIGSMAIAELVAARRSGTGVIGLSG
jgi:hypothetical protein